MKALLLAATSSLALTGFAMAQTATDTTTTTDPAATATGTDMTTGTDPMTGTAADPMTGMTTDPMTGTATDTMGTTGTATDTMGTTGTATDMTTTTAPVTTTTTDTMTTTTTDAMATDQTTATAAGTAVMSADNPGMLGSWIMNRRIWTTNQPSSTAWQTGTLTERPAEWTDIAQVNDIVVDPQGSIVGYVADIGGFLGLGAKSVLMDPDALHFVQIGDDAFFATNYTREELEALPDFDTTTVMR